MRVLVFSSLNIDRVYKVRSFVRPGETISAEGYACYCGGKGFNLATAMARAGVEVFFAGSVGSDAQMLLEEMERSGIRNELLRHSDVPNGHAVIQVNSEGQNCIVVVAGANADIPESYVDSVLARFAPGDVIVLQNEIANVGYILAAARRCGLVTAFNPSPIDTRISAYDLSGVNYLFINEGEGEALTGEKSAEAVLSALRSAYPNMNLILTLGHRGAAFLSQDGQTAFCGVMKTTAVDTTAAGDTYMGFFLSVYLQSGDAGTALKTAAIASAIAVSRQGAAASIPRIEEVREFPLSVVGKLLP